jgi:hypothetical protein
VIGRADFESSDKNFELLAEAQEIPSGDNQPRRNHIHRLHPYQRIDIRKFDAFGKDIAQSIVWQIC